MSDYVYVDIVGANVSEPTLLEGKTAVMVACSAAVPHNLLSHLRLHVSPLPGVSRLSVSLGSTSLSAILWRRARRAYGLAILDALINWARNRGWQTSVLLEGHRGNQPIPNEQTATTTLEAVLSSLPKGPYAIRILLDEHAV